MKFKDQNDDIHIGDTAEDIVQSMADTKFQPVRSLGRYRKATAKRIKELFGKDIDPTNSETFVASMVEAELLEEIQ